MSNRFRLSEIQRAIQELKNVNPELGVAKTIHEYEVYENQCASFIILNHEMLLEAMDVFEKEQREEWFFRWAARATAGHSTEKQAIGMIWHHPNNPYFKKNPWEKS